MVHPEGSHQHSLSLRIRVYHPNTRKHVRLLGPCYKTGHLESLSQRPKPGGQATGVWISESHLGQHAVQDEVPTSARAPRRKIRLAAGLSPGHHVDRGL